MSARPTTRRYVAVIGLGQFGHELARALATRCEVLAIDRDEALVDAIADHVQAARVLDAREFDSMAQVLGAGFDEAVITMTEHLESSVLATLHCRRLGLQRIRAKCLSDDHAAVLRAVGATDVIFPERETAARLATQIQHPNLLDFIPVAPGYSVLDLIPPASYVGRTLADIDLRRRMGVLVIAVRRGPSTFHFLPGPDHRIETGEVLVMIGKDDDLLKFEEAGGRRSEMSLPAVTTAPTADTGLGPAPVVLPYAPEPGAAATTLADTLAHAAQPPAPRPSKRTPAAKAKPKAKAKGTSKKKRR